MFCIIIRQSACTDSVTWMRGVGIMCIQDQAFFEEHMALMSNLHVKSAPYIHVFPTQTAGF